jgi:glycosyltransferase involved in cell wall biosynthesis
MNAERRTVLIFEPLAGGHRESFIRWLREASPEYPGCRFVFFTADDVGETLSKQLAGAGRWKKQRLLYRLFKEACDNCRPDHVLILELTHLELLLAMFGSPIPLSAILFVQYPELPRNLKFFLKHWKTRLLLHRVPVENLFLLNGESSCQFLRKHFRVRARFIPLSDPAPDACAEPEFSFDAEGCRICLFFGAVSRRKGADFLLDTLRRISPRAAAENLFVFCGEPEADYRTDFEQAVQSLRSERADINLQVALHSVSDERMTAMFEQADLILMPYTRPEYSSGILALAAKAGTPVLGPPGGLLGRLIRENDLGLAAPLTPNVFEQSVTLNRERCRKFVVQNTIEKFTRPILNAVCNES